MSARIAMRMLTGVALAVFACANATAHKPSDSYLTLRVDGPRLEGRWDIAIRDLDETLGLDEDQDGQVRWGELRKRQRDIEALIVRSLGIESERGPCPIAVTSHRVDEHSDGAYAVATFSAPCRRTPESLAIRYSFLFERDATHRGLARFVAGGNESALVFSSDQREQRIALWKASSIDTLATYVREGVWHIWIGFDHLLFVVCLLLPAVLVRDANRWVACEDWRVAGIGIVSVVTAFTIAHSITLSLAAVGIVEAPSRWVEAAIALSVVAAALNNLFPLLPVKRWTMAFVFGLVHGLGFAAVLSDLGLPKQDFALALLGFNLGVEIGQLAIVAAVLPMAFLLRERSFYRVAVLGGGSIAVAGLGTWWFLERAFDLPGLFT